MRKVLVHIEGVGRRRCGTVVGTLGSGFCCLVRSLFSAPSLSTNAFLTASATYYFGPSVNGITYLSGMGVCLTKFKSTGCFRWTPGWHKSQMHLISFFRLLRAPTSPRTFFFIFSLQQKQKTLVWQNGLRLPRAGWFSIFNGSSQCK